jgi:hypothetical protein
MFESDGTLWLRLISSNHVVYVACRNLELADILMVVVSIMYDQTTAR